MVKIIIEPSDNDYINHAEGISSVSRILKEPDINFYQNIGFVDKDKKNIPLYFDEFEVIEEKENVIFKKHPLTNDYIIMVVPAIEQFLLNQLQQINKKPSDYDLPDDLKNFCKKLKSTRIESHQGYKNMILDLKKSQAPGIDFICTSVQSLKV